MQHQPYLRRRLPADAALNFPHRSGTPVLDFTLVAGVTTFSAFNTPASWPTGAPGPPSRTPSRIPGRPAEAQSPAEAHSSLLTCLLGRARQTTTRPGTPPAAQLGIPLAAVSGGAR